MSNPRIIAGSKRGLRLKSIPGNTTRPITGLVKEALFNILGQEIESCRFLDLFGGTGSVGIEAFSRGADEIVFVEKNFTAYKTLVENISIAEIQTHAKVLRMDAFKYLEKTGEVPFDYIFVAPPQFKGMWKKAVQLLDQYPHWLSTDGEIIVQIDYLENEEIELRNLKETKQKRYGDTLLLFYRNEKSVD